MSNTATKWLIMAEAPRYHRKMLLGTAGNEAQARLQARELAERRPHLKVYISIYTTANGRLIKHEVKHLEDL